MSDVKQPSFLRLVPTWQRPELERSEFRQRRWSDLTASSVSSTLSSDYGENGFLVLTAHTSFDECEQEDGDEE